jgi:hypothetical protein
MLEGDGAKGRASFDETRTFMGIHAKRDSRQEEMISQGDRLFYRVPVAWIPGGETK